MRDKICGYLDDRGTFHKRLVDANTANMRYEIAHIMSAIKELKMNVAREINSIMKEQCYLVGDKSYSIQIAERAIDEYFRKNSMVPVLIKIEIDEMNKKISDLECLQQLPDWLRGDWWLRKEITYKKENND